MGTRDFFKRHHKNIRPIRIYFLIYTRARKRSAHTRIIIKNMLIFNQTHWDCLTICGRVFVGERLTAKRSALNDSKRFKNGSRIKQSMSGVFHAGTHIAALYKFSYNTYSFTYKTSNIRSGIIMRTCKRRYCRT